MHTGSLTFDLIAALLLLHVAVAAWTGLLAARWKGRNGWRWFATALLAPVLAAALLALVARAARQDEEADMALQHMDGTSLLN